jgi:hypothetical protein
MKACEESTSFFKKKKANLEEENKKTTIDGFPVEISSPCQDLTGFQIVYGDFTIEFNVFDY